MKAIICGGRKYRLTQKDIAFLDSLHEMYCFEEIITGGARGADTAGYTWAVKRKIPTKVIQAQWERYGLKAGPIRNTAMLAYMGEDGLVIAFPGGRGTANMVQQALDHHVTVQWSSGLSLCTLDPVQHDHEESQEK